MDEIKIHVLHTGKICVSPDLPFGGENSNLIKLLKLSLLAQDYFI